MQRYADGEIPYSAAGWITAGLDPYRTLRQGCSPEDFKAVIALHGGTEALAALIGVEADV
jgi:hypothetical protein